MLEALERLGASGGISETCPMSFDLWQSNYENAIQQVRETQLAS